MSNTTRQLPACTACHGAEGKGNLGLAPNLTDKVWLYGGSEAAIVETITRIAPSIDPQNRTVLVYVDVKALPGAGYGSARAGMFARGTGATRTPCSRGSAASVTDRTPSE